MARELHDETGQALASLMVGLHNVEEAETATYRVPCSLPVSGPARVTEVAGRETRCERR